MLYYTILYDTILTITYYMRSRCLRRSVQQPSKPMSWTPSHRRLLPTAFVSWSYSSFLFLVLEVIDVKHPVMLCMDARQRCVVGRPSRAHGQGRPRARSRVRALARVVRLGRLRACLRSCLRYNILYIYYICIVLWFTTTQHIVYYNRNMLSSQAPGLALHSEVEAAYAAPKSQAPGLAMPREAGAGFLDPAAGRSGCLAACLPVCLAVCVAPCLSDRLHAW